jgi:hypothetical protein
VGVEEKGRENFIDDSFMYTCVCVSSPPSSKCTGGGGWSYKSLTSATVTAARPAVAERVGVYTVTAIPRGGLFLREKGSAHPYIPQDVKKWAMLLILR